VRLAPGPRGTAVVGKLFDVRRDRLGLVTTIHREFGDIVRFRMMSRTLHLISRPDYIRHVLVDHQANYCKGVGLSQAKRWLGEGLVTSEGAAWARQRRLVQPSYQRAHLPSFGAVVTDCAAAAIEDWRAAAFDGKPIELAGQMMRLTLRVIARVMFSTELADDGRLAAAFTTALRDAMDRMTAMVALPDWIPVPGKRRFVRAISALENVVSEIIEEHRNSGRHYDDLVSRLLAERDENGDSLDSREIRDQVLTMLLAGHETTATSIAWTLYLLDRHPEARRRVVEETDALLCGRVPTPEDLPLLTWTRMVYEEALRLYPPVWLIPRRTLAADEIGGYYIPPASEVLICPYVMHRHPDYWPDPDLFHPARFSAERSACTPPYCYLPFGGGPRACVGKTLAMTEALLVLAMVVQTYELQVVPGHPVVPEPLLTLRFRNGILVRPILRDPHRAAGVSRPLATH
jgi:cytochrome P450